MSQTFLLKDKVSLQLAQALAANTPANTIYSIGKKQFAEIKLTTREKECLFYFVRGKTCKMIGKMLGISYRTVEEHLSHIKAKFQCHSKSELIERAITEGYACDLPSRLFNKKFIDSLN